VAGGHMQTKDFHTLTSGELIDRFGYKKCR
jgi:hypothetical protein